MDLVEKPTIRPTYPARDFHHKKKKKARRHSAIYFFSLHTAGSISAVDRAAAVYISPCVCGFLAFDYYNIYVHICLIRERACNALFVVFLTSFGLALLAIHVCAFANVEKTC